MGYNTTLLSRQILSKFDEKQRKLNNLKYFCTRYSSVIDVKLIPFHDNYMFISAQFRMTFTAEQQFHPKWL